jgi:hypothetical protein
VLRVSTAGFARTASQRAFVSSAIIATVAVNETKASAPTKKKKTQTKLRKELDRIFSLYIRNRDRNENGMPVCYTCDRAMEFRSSQCGHFVPRQYLAVRYSEINCHTQCYACNMLYNGQPSKFALNLERDYGRGIVKKLESQRQIITKNFPYEALIVEYTAKLEANYPALG